MKLMPVNYLGFTAMDKRFSSPMLPWIVSEIRKRDYCEKLSLGIEDGILQAYNQDFELQFSHKISQLSRFSQADMDACTFLYLLKEDRENLYYCYLYQAKKPLDALHVIDEVLNPKYEDINNLKTAYDFLTNSENKVTSFLYKIQENKLQGLYKSPGKYTFFVPVDTGIDNYKYSMIDKYVVHGHTIKNVVLFTKAAGKDFPFETMANGDYIYIVLNVTEVYGRFFVRSKTILGDTTHQKGDTIAEIIKANIPVGNGVVHLISKPLAIFERKLKPFPFLPILEKLSNDPELDYVYNKARIANLNNILKDETLKLTVFAAKDSAWVKMKENNLELKSNELDTLKNHLVISNTAYSMDRLLSLSRANNYTDLKLKTLKGVLSFTVFKMNDYYIKYHDKYIKVHRPDFECTNGIVHIIDAPLADVRKIPDVEETVWGQIKKWVTDL